MICATKGESTGISNVGRSLGDGGWRHSFQPVQSFVGMCMCRGEAIQTGEDSVLDVVELGQGLCLAGQRVLDLGEVVFNFHNAACDGNEIFGEGTNLVIEVFVGFVVEVGETRIEATNL